MIESSLIGKMSVNWSALARFVKSFAPCFIFAVIAEALICSAAARAYSPLILALLTTAWGFGSLILAWFEPRPRIAYFGSVALSAPSISYSMLGYGPLEMGGFLHALCAGALAVPFYYMFQRIRVRRQ
jgi:CHASE2 domain-containing sensor protein